MEKGVDGGFIAEPRRRFMRISTAWITAGILAPMNLFAAEKVKSKPGKKDEEISPVEDLMREHGALARILLLYEEVSSRVKRGKEFSPQVLSGAAELIRRFVEDYHEKLEETYLFPRFEKAGKHADLVKILLQQHQAGRRLTEQIKGLATSSKVKSEDSKKLSEYLDQFIRMYRPHKAREDTVLFPSFHGVVSSKEYDSLGEKFEDKEEELFGKNGFEKIVEEVAGLERDLEIYELSEFTPKV